ncbi:hypothetical protein V2G26_014551 [Clonostachys chloroleuca]
MPLDRSGIRHTDAQEIDARERSPCRQLRRLSDRWKTPFQLATAAHHLLRPRPPPDSPPSLLWPSQSFSSRKSERDTRSLIWAGIRDLYRSRSQGGNKMVDSRIQNILTKQASQSI